jgi:MFS family permease
VKIPTANSVRAIFAYVLALLLLSQLAFSLFAWRLFDQELPPEMARKAATIGQSIQGKLIAAVNAGIPFDKLVGIDDFFSDTIKSNRDLAFLALTSSDGTVRNAVGIDVRAAGDIMSGHDVAANGKMERFTSRVAGMDYAVTSLPIVVGGTHVGTLDVGVSQSFIDSRIGEIRIDVVTVVLISLLVAYEVLRFILSVRLEEPLWQVWSILDSVAKGDFREIAGVRNNDLGRLAKTVNHLIFAVDAAAARLSGAMAALGTQGQGKAIQEAWARIGARFTFAPTPPGPRVRPQPLVIQIRILTFLFMFAEQLSRPFLPLMVRSLLPHWAVGHSADILTGLPISAFMFVVAIGMPVAGRWCDRLGPRNAFTVGAIMMTVGLFGAAASISIYDFTVWRIVTAAGYATMFMACQGFVFGNTGERERAKGISTFVGAIMVSEVCAPAIGGILADRIGPHPVFAIGAVVAIVVACLGRSILQKHERRRAVTEEDAPKLLNIIVGLHNVRFVALLLFAAVPAKMMLTGFLFYLVPLVLTSLGSSQAEIGRIVIAYGIPGLLLMPLFASLADRFSVHGLMVGLGGIVAGLGMLPILFYPDEKMVLVGVAGLGIGQAMSIAPQIALIEQVCEKEVAAFGEASVLGLFRLVERTGAALGSLVAGALLASFGPVDAMGVLGAASAVSAVVFSIVFLALGVRPEEPLDTIAPALLGQGADA